MNNSEFLRQSPPKIFGLNLKNYFNEKNKISKKSKSKSESLSFFQKRNQKIENVDKNSVTLVYLEFFFFNFRGPIIRRWKKVRPAVNQLVSRLLSEVNKLFQFMIRIWISEIQLFCYTNVTSSMSRLWRETNLLYYWK